MTAEQIDPPSVEPVPGLRVTADPSGQAVLSANGRAWRLDRAAVLRLADALFTPGASVTPPSAARVPWSRTLGLTIAVASARRFGVRPADLFAPGRDPEVVRARHVAMFLCRDLTDASLPQIGRFFRRDHTTVLAAVTKVGVRERYEDDTRAVLAALRREITG